MRKLCVENSHYCIDFLFNLFILSKIMINIIFVSYTSIEMKTRDEKKACSFLQLVINELKCQIIYYITLDLVKHIY